MKSKTCRLLTGAILILFILSNVVLAGVDNSKVGTRVFNFLKIETAARPTSMGSAFTGLADDESALFYNPAGVATLEGRHFMVGYHNSIFDIQSGFLGYIQPVGEGRKLSFYIDYLNYGDFTRTDQTGQQLGTFSGSDMLFAVGYSAQIKDRWLVGAVAKFIYEKVDTYSATGGALDLSSKLSLPDGRTSFGLMIQNLGTQFSSFVSGGDKKPLPLNLRGGFASRLKGLPLTVAADAVLPSDNSVYVNLGAEYYKLKPLFLRLGWSSFGSNYKTGTTKDDLAGFSGGFGIQYQRLQISYTISPQAELGTTHRITLTGGFD